MFAQHFKVQCRSFTWISITAALHPIKCQLIGQQFTYASLFVSEKEMEWKQTKCIHCFKCFPSESKSFGNEVQYN
jgi:hypothetical protein